jgi:hypothetical protein
VRAYLKALEILEEVLDKLYDATSLSEAEKIFDEVERAAKLNQGELTHG